MPGTRLLPASDAALGITCRSEAGGRTVLVLTGELDAAAASGQLPRCAGLVLDVADAALADMPGLRALIAVQREAAALRRPPIALRGVRPLFARTLHIAGADHLFPRECAPALAAHAG
ncbi:hypothetical protein [Actinospica robiniae]|uniref:hypothetical protein n=1 Tax=Actinospica robiniae TaxID=304901 RepID=UPI0003F7E23A|nr:hypothetical protein [Actinospica robiniae]